MKTSKIKKLLLIIFLFANIIGSFSQGEPDPWSAPPPGFDDDTPDNTPPPLPIDEKIYLLLFSGVLLGGLLIVKNKQKSN